MVGEIGILFVEIYINRFELYIYPTSLVTAVDGTNSIAFWSSTV